jgi:hypothetical protein
LIGTLASLILPSVFAESVRALISIYVVPLHKADSDKRKADIATLTVSIPSTCFLRNGALHGAQQC